MRLLVGIATVHHRVTTPSYETSGGRDVEAVIEGAGGLGLPELARDLEAIADAEGRNPSELFREMFRVYRAYREVGQFETILAIEGGITLATSPPLLAELGRVLTGKVGWQTDDVRAALAQIVRIGEIVEPERNSPWCRLGLFPP